MRREQRDRGLALALLLGVLAAGCALLIHPWFVAPLLDAESTLQTARERGERVQAQLAQEDEIELRLAQARRHGAGQVGFLPEASAELASAGLVQRLERVVAQASPDNRSCAITNRAPLPSQARPDEPYPRVTVQVRLRCGTPELASVLNDLEQGRDEGLGVPQLFIDHVDVMAQRYMGARAPNEASGGLDVSFDLYGYLRPAAVVVPEVPHAP